MKNFNRILLKLSGEGLSANGSGMLDISKLQNLAQEIKLILNSNKELAIVIGGGNICRGVNSKEGTFSRITLDNMGVIATIINGLALADVLNQNNIPCVVASALEINKLTEFYNVEKAKEYLKAKKVLILVGGIATPYFSTDTTAIIRASELECSAVFKATQVDGVFNKDPKIHKDAFKLSKVTYDDIINNNLTVMDLQSIVIAKANKIPIYVFNMQKERHPVTKLIDGSLDHSIIS